MGYISSAAAVAVFFFSFVALLGRIPDLRKNAGLIGSNLKSTGIKGVVSKRTARPVVLVGLNEAVGRRVSANLMPEFEGTVP